MGEQKVTLSIVLTDIVGFPSLGQENETVALELLSIHNDMMKKACAQ